ncbi:hypothetical protein [Aquimarina algicola]|uniref:Uncharacterized protein n=1 Tax=Aquimarina algicola TaxID=2589995 RepID=A0A504J5M5_9FLAO|nr:hypothetical protein [Aquimarina algicola]TPN83855.1 hypothetical protein FHK87_17975 [Aquimarina algicola]
MKQIKLIILVIYIFVTSCQSQEIEITKQPTDLPVKISISKSYNDSTIVNIMLPQKLLVKNGSNKTRLVQTRLSLSGANIYGEKGSRLYAFKDSLVFPPYKQIFSENEKQVFSLYASYQTYLTDKEKNQLLKGSKLVQLKHKKEVYDVNPLIDVNKIISKKIPDSLKGFIRFSLYDMPLDSSSYKNIPIEF